MSKEIISRTITVNKVKFTALNDSRVLMDCESTIPARIDTVDKADKFMRKNIELPNGWKFVCVDEIFSESTLKGMYIEDFMRESVKVSERSKDTRDCITKEISAFFSRYEYADGRNIKEAEVMIPASAAKSVESADKYLRKVKTYNGKFIGTLQILESKAIYAMSEEKFNDLAKPMADRFHIAE